MYHYKYDPLMVWVPPCIPAVATGALSAAVVSDQDTEASGDGKEPQVGLGRQVSIV